MPLSVRLRRACVPVLLALLCAASSAALDAGDAWAASALSPRHSGLEPPGGPKPMEGLPAMGNAGNTTERGMGYTDAYGRVLEDRPPPEAKPRHRPGPGAYGGYGREAKPVRPLPEVQESRPAWNFN